MPVLKADQYTDDALQPQRFNLDDIAAEARRIVERARAERELMLAEAAAEIEQQRQAALAAAQAEGRQAGRQEGRRAGHEEALQQAQAEFRRESEQTLTALQACLGEFDAVKQDILWRAEQATVKLAATIAEKVIKQLGLVRSEVTSENVKVALELIDQRSHVEIMVHPSHLDALQQFVGGAEQALGRFAAITIKGDESVTPGGCRLVTEHGGVDADLPTQIARIAEQLIMPEAAPENNDETPAMQT